MPSTFFLGANAQTIKYSELEQTIGLSLLSKAKQLKGKNNEETIIPIACVTCPFVCSGVSNYFFGIK